MVGHPKFLDDYSMWYCSGWNWGWHRFQSGWARSWNWKNVSFQERRLGKNKITPHTPSLSIALGTSLLEQSMKRLIDILVLQVLLIAGVCWRRWRWRQWRRSRSCNAPISMFSNLMMTPMHWHSIKSSGLKFLLWGCKICWHVKMRSGKMGGSKIQLNGKTAQSFIHKTQWCYQLMWLGSSQEIVNYMVSEDSIGCYNIFWLIEIL